MQTSAQQSQAVSARSELPIPHRTPVDPAPPSPTFKPEQHRFNDCQCPSTCSSFLLCAGRGVNSIFTPVYLSPFSQICTCYLSQVSFLLSCLASILTDCLFSASMSEGRWGKVSKANGTGCQMILELGQVKENVRNQIQIAHEIAGI